MGIHRQTLGASLGHLEYCHTGHPAGFGTGGACSLPGSAQHFPQPCTAATRRLVDHVSSRSINSLIWSLLLVSILGPGVLAGIIAIALRSIGFVAKLLYEAIEEIDETQVEAITATGLVVPK